MTNFLKRMMRDETGASATEYAILLAIVGAAVVAAVGVFSAGINTVFTNLTNLMTGWVT
jgi:pilus assembly protein Flp/PilA